MKQIKEYLRIIFKSVIKSLVKGIVDKHNIKVILVVGSSGTVIAREALYNIFSISQNVRRNVTPIWWDMSIPLNILGYEDKRYSMLGWVMIFFKASIAYFRNTKYEHMLIIEANTKYTDMAEFWGEMMSPKVILVLDSLFSELEIINRLVIDKSQVVLVYDADKLADKGEFKKSISFGVDKADVIYTHKHKLLSISNKKKTIKMYSNLPVFEITPIVGAIAVALNLKLKVNQIVEGVEEFELHPQYIQNVISNIIE